MKCAHCGIDTPRLTVDQRYCPECAGRIAAQDAADEARRSVVRSRPADVTPYSGQQDRQRTAA